MSYQNPYNPNSFRSLPVVVKNLLIINILMFALTLLFKSQFGIDLNDKLGLHFVLSQEFQPYQIITYMFMHSTDDFFHLFFNMFALWMFGNTLENLWGPKRFLIYYLITGIGAAVCHYTVIYFQLNDTLNFINAYIANPSLSAFDEFANAVGLTQDAHYLLSQHSPNEAIQISVDMMRNYKIELLNAPVIIGASGAIFGILLGFGMLFPNTPLMFMFLPIPIKAKWFVIGYGLIELVSGIKGAVGDNVAHFAHLGGMLFGFILIKYWQKNKKTFY